MSLIEFKNVVKRFDGEEVLSGLSFSVEKGEVFVIVGPSGTGKSVTLKTIVRLLSPNSGSVCVDGVEVNSCSEKELALVRSKIGYLFQGAALLQWMTVEENVALPLKETTDLPDCEIEEKVSLALEAVELTEARKKYPSEISGGMQKRAGLARAIVRNVDIVLYDEPTSGLDPVTTLAVNRFILKLNREMGLTSIVVTHDLASALNYASRIMLLKDGKVVECAPPKEFLASKKPEVLEFLSAMKGDLQ